MHSSDGDSRRDQILHDQCSREAAGRSGDAAASGRPSGSGATASAADAISRRDVLKGFGAGAAVLGAARLSPLSRFSNRPLGNLARGQAAGGSTINIGYISPETGPLSDFSLADKYVLSKIRAASPYAKGLTVGGKTYTLSITEYDSQSDPSRASQVAKSVATGGVDLVVTSSAPETTNPVALACEQLRTPCLATVVPWEAWYAGLGGDPLKPTTTYAYNAMFFFGIEEFAGCFLPMWNRIESETKAAKIFAGMFPNDADGNAFRAGFPPFAEAKGYKFVDGGAYTDGASNYSTMIELFKSKGCEFFTNCPLPPDFKVFWTQAVEAGWKPKLATVAKVMLFPSDVFALGSISANIATDAWWTPYSPYKSVFTGETSGELALGYQQQSGTEWIQSMGSTYSLFEVAVEALKAVDDPHDHAQLAAALHHVKYDGMCGPVDFASGPAPGVAIINPVGIQWKVPTKSDAFAGKVFPFQPFVVDNTLNKSVPINGDLEPTTY
jgi:branched-chain amino acid transport system substrate-binding protein